VLAGVLGVAMRRGVGQPPIGSVAAGFSSAATFELPRFDQGTVSLSAFEDQPVFLYFWASWCTPCRTEAPVIQRLWPEYEALGYAFVGVNILDQEAEARRFIQEYGLTFPLVRDVEGSVYLEYGVYGMPESFFLKPGLVVQEKYLGELSESVLRERLAQVAGTEAPRAEVVQ
jgi:peroxiredoxin